jgi:hypothetical protein
VYAELVLSWTQRFERVGGGAERAIKFRATPTRLERRSEPLTFRTICERHGAGHVGLVEELGSRRSERMGGRAERELRELIDDRRIRATIRGLIRNYHSRVG